MSESNPQKVELSTLKAVSSLVRYLILLQVNAARSGHTTTSLSAVELMTSLYFSELRQDLENLSSPYNDRVIFSKGHASPLVYALYAAAGKLSFDDLKEFRSVSSPLEGHPTFRFPFTEAPTGSLGQGLSIGLGLAYESKFLSKIPHRVFVLMGDGEVAEGQVWEAISLASYYNVDNLVGIVDMNRLGQTQETQYGWSGELYQRRFEAFGWAAKVVDGHDIPEILSAFEWARSTGRPSMIIGRTIKGKGVPFWEDKEGWHSQPIPGERFAEAVEGLGDIDLKLRVAVRVPERPSEIKHRSSSTSAPKEPVYDRAKLEPTKRAFGNALVRLGHANQDIIVLDGDVQNSSHAEYFAKTFPARFVQCFIAEQNMVSFAEGLALKGRRPFVVTFAAFLTRAFDQFRMAALGKINLLVSGSYVGASIGKDGPSNMGLEDIAMFRALQNSVILYPADAISTERLTELMLEIREGIVYLRTTREPLPLLYGLDDRFFLGGSRTLKESKEDKATIVAAGLTVHEALRAQDLLLDDGISVRVIDCYSVKPIDAAGLKAAAAETGGNVIVVEDHWIEGGLGDAVLSALAECDAVAVRKIAVERTPVSGEPRDVMRLVGIDAESIRDKVKLFLGERLGTLSGKTEDLF